jgi:adenylylsulfate kinase-like enzyme
MLIFVTGKPKAGKTTLGRLLKTIIPNSVLLDGDELREIYDYNSYTLEGREKWMKSVGKQALNLELQGYNPIIALVSPLSNVRKEILSWFTNPFLIYVDGDDSHMWAGSTYEIPDKSECKNFFIYKWS